MARADLDLNDAAAPAIAVEDEFDFRDSMEELLSEAETNTDCSPPPPYALPAPPAGAVAYICQCGQQTDPHQRCPRCGHTRYL